MSLTSFFWNLSKTTAYSKNIKLLILPLSSWFFQGLLYMDKTERNFKIILDLAVFVILVLSFNMFLNLFLAIIFSLISAHSINWIFNGQIFVLLKNLDFIKIDPDIFEMYTKEINKRISDQPSISAAAIYGSFSRDELKITSDLDIRIIRKSGFINGIYACIFVLKERTHAFFSKFPLDIYLLDNDKNLTKLSETTPVIILDRDDILKKFYARNI
jgi:L-malate glycosyltransferase